MSKGTGGQGGGGKKRKKNGGKRAGKPAAPKPSGPPSGLDANPVADRSREMHSQTLHNRVNTSGVPRRTSG